MFWEWFQQSQIKQSMERSNSAQFDAQRAMTAIAALEERVDQLSLLCHALQEELQRQSGFDEDRLSEAMVEIDLRDGQRDGRHRGLPEERIRRCRACDRNTRQGRPNCFWCGETFSPVG